MVKGSGMIAPQLATMLCVITHRCRRDRRTASSRLERRSRNVVQPHDVDGCMSTNDTVLLLASGASGIERTRTSSTSLWLRPPPSPARQIIGDGEGASHDIRVKVTGATTEEAKLLGMWSRGRSVQFAQMRCHLRQRPELGPYRQLPRHRAARRRTI